MRLVTGRGSFHNRLRVAVAVAGAGRSAIRGTEKDSVFGKDDDGDSFVVLSELVGVVCGVDENPWQ